MTLARSRLVDLDVTRYYHCISRCVRRAFLCGEGFEHRKAWIEDRLERLAGSFAISVCGFAVMDNHLHVLVRLDPDRAAGWSDEEVVRRWIGVYPPPLDLDDPKTVQMWVDHQAADAAKVAEYRRRLTELGWFMKALKEPLARWANKEDDCKGTFWESRYKSIAILDDEALLAACAYIDLNPVAAGIAATPETSHHTSVRQRVQHARAKGKLRQLKAAASGNAAARRAASRVEQSHWLCPVEDRRNEMVPAMGDRIRRERRGRRQAGMHKAREGMLENFSLGNYLLLVDYTSRLCRQGKARVSGDLANIFDRLGTSAEFWGTRLKELFARSRLFGNFFATDRERLRDLAARRGNHHLDNVVSMPAAVG